MLNDLIDNPIIRHYNSPHNLNIEKDLHCQTTKNTREQPGKPSNLKHCKTVNRIWDTKAMKHSIPHSPEGWSLRETVTEKRPRVVVSHILERLSKWQRQESVEENQEASFWVEKQKFKQETVNQLTGSAAEHWKKECKSEEQDAQGAPVLVAESWLASPIVNPFNHARQSIAIKNSCPNTTKMEILQLHEAWGRISKDTTLSGGDISPGTMSALPLLSLLVFQIRQSQDETNYPVTCYCFLQPFSICKVYFFCLPLSNS